MLTNNSYFEETVNLIQENPAMQNVGVHINLIEGKPVTNISSGRFLDENGNWDIKKIGRKLMFFDKNDQSAILMEIFAQIDKALQRKIVINHLDSHYHLHTLPGFYGLFMKAASQYKLKLRLAQTHNEGNLMKFLYRRVINQFFKAGCTAYADYFENVNYFLNSRRRFPANKRIEIMLHPDFEENGSLTDHFDNKSVTQWVDYLKQKKHGIDLASGN